MKGSETGSSEVTPRPEVVKEEAEGAEKKGEGEGEEEVDPGEEDRKEPGKVDIK